MYTLILATKSGYSVSTFSHSSMAQMTYQEHTDRADVVGLYLYSPVGELMLYSMTA